MKSIALKISALKNVGSDEEIAKINDSEKLNLLVRKFGKSQREKG